MKVEIRKPVEGMPFDVAAVRNAEALWRLLQQLELGDEAKVTITEAHDGSAVLRSVKCFQTASMPKAIYDNLAIALRDGDEGDRCAWHVVRCEDGSSDELCDWFNANGAADGEKVLIERGDWD